MLRTAAVVAGETEKIRKKKKKNEDEEKHVRATGLYLRRMDV